MKKFVSILFFAFAALLVNAQGGIKTVKVQGGGTGGSGGGTLQQSFNLLPGAIPQIYGGSNTQFGIKGFHQFRFQTDTTSLTYAELLLDPYTTGEARATIKKTDGAEGGFSFSTTNTSLWSFGNRFSVSFGATSNDSKFLFKSHNTVTHTGSEISGDSSKIIIAPNDSLMFKNIPGSGPYVALTDSGKMYRTSGTGGVVNPLTFNATNAGASPGASFDGSSSTTISANTVGAVSISDSSSTYITPTRSKTLIDSLAALIKIPKMIKKTVNDTTTITVRKNISEFSFTVEANKKYRLTGFFKAACTSTGGILFDINAPSGSSIDGAVTGVGTSVNNYAAAQIVGTALTSNAIVKNAISNGVVNIDAAIFTSSTAGTITVGFASAVATQTSTISAGSSLTLIEVQ